MKKNVSSNNSNNFTHLILSLDVGTSLTLCTFCRIFNGIESTSTAITAVQISQHNLKSLRIDVFIYARIQCAEIYIRLAYVDR